MNLITGWLIAGLLLFATPAIAQDARGPAAYDAYQDANLEIYLQKIKADKKLLVATNMELTDAEAKNFWPLYDAYQQELAQVNLRLGKTIKDYAEAYTAGRGIISNDMAKKLMNEALSVDEAEVKLRRAYADKMSKVLSMTKTARYLQIENKIRSILKAELAQQIPLVY